jgi:hypothetical protein
VQRAIIKTQRLAIGLTFVNLVILAFALLRAHRIANSDVVPVPCGHALEIVADQGRVRAMIRVFPASPTAKSKGVPNVKIAAIEDGSAVTFAGEPNPTNVQLLARGMNTSLKLVNKDGHEQLIKPQ